MLDQFSRTRLLLGDAGMDSLSAARVAVFGIGGVGAFTAEALARSGIGAIEIIDDDRICLTNLNRQLIALHSTVGQSKAEVMAGRLLDINPNLSLTVRTCFFNQETAGQFDFGAYDYVVDAIDTVSSKLLLVELARAAGTPIISAMGAGNKLDPARLEVDDIYNTSVCPLARVMRYELRKRGIPSLKVVYSKEKPRKPLEDAGQDCRHNCICPPGTQRNCTVRRQVPGSTAFVPAAAGLILAGEVVCDLAGIEKSQ
ncbi:MAG: tRNA threonylcarbamoyladenosine dehydratase [Clostridiales bacterium]|nr:tRNA threonylcarbamoyladenosine dehydratase [Clostridiales bacterium]